MRFGLLAGLCNWGTVKREEWMDGLMDGWRMECVDNEQVRWWVGLDGFGDIRFNVLDYFHAMPAHDEFEVSLPPQVFCVDYFLSRARDLHGQVVCSRKWR
jgi:hypothetical protein